MLSRILIIIFLFISTNLHSQSVDEISDSALHELCVTQNDTSVIKYLAEYAWRLQSIYEDDSSLAFIDKGLKLSEKYNFYKYCGTLYKRKSIYYSEVLGDTANYLKYRLLSLKSHYENKQSKKIIESLQILGDVYFLKGVKDSSIHYYKKALVYSFFKKDTISIFESYAYYINQLHSLDQLTESKMHLDSLLEFVHSLKDSKYTGYGYEAIGDCYSNAENTPSAIYYYLKSKNAFHKNHQSVEEYNVLYNLSFYYESTNNSEREVACLVEAQKIIENNLEDFDNEFPNHYNGLGWAYFNFEKLDSALKYFKLSEKAFLENDIYNLSIAYPYGNLGLVYFKKDELDSALKYSIIALNLFEKQEDLGGIAEAQLNIGKVYLKQNKIEKAEFYITEALKNSKLWEENNQIIDSYYGLHEISVAKGDWKTAAAYLKRYVNLKDSLFSMENLTAITKAETNLTHEKDQAVITNMETKSALDKAVIQQQKYITYGIIIFCFLVLLSLFLILKNWKEKKKALKTLNQQHNELIENKNEIEKNNREIALQKDQLEVQHDEIIASINFASRIQRALLKPEDHKNHRVPKHFIYYEPRDIVSGDFYWAVLKEPYLYLSAADCTGHGVPGAMMSMLGIAFLNEIIAEKQTLNPSEILTLLRKKIIKELGQEANKDTSYHEGMDMSLIRLNLDTLELEFCGANNPLYIFRNKELIELKGDKQPVAYSSEMKPFIEQKFQLLKNDTIYLFSDGYPDQFGGVKGKKMMYRAFKNYLNEIVDLDMSTQKQKLKENFHTWKGDLEQVDDVCVIGLKV